MRTARIERFRADQRIGLLMHGLARDTDHLLNKLWKLADMPSDWALFAVGGYGRGELQPASDVDLLLLAPEPEQARDAAASADAAPSAPQPSPADSPSADVRDTPLASTPADATTASPAPALSDDTIAHIERFIGACWDIGLEIGHSVRTPAQCAQAAREDITTMTALLERRQLTGHRRAAGRRSAGPRGDRPGCAARRGCA